MAWLESEPLWVVGVVLMTALMLAHEFGLRLARRARLAKEADDEERGYVISSALALLGLLTAFTFSAAQDRWRVRQDLVVAEANAIGTTYLRFQLLDAPYRETLSRDMLLYTEARVAADHRQAGAADARRTDALQAQIWRDLTPAVRTNRVPTLNPSILQTVNETFDLAASRRAADEVRVPISVVRVLAVSALVSAAIVGFTSGGRRRQFGIFVGAMLLLTLAYCVILDLDRPISGTIQINHAPMQRALEAIRRSEAPPAAPQS